MPAHVHDPFRCPAHAGGCDCPALAGWLCNPYYVAGHCPAGIETMPGRALPAPGPESAGERGCP